MEWLRLSRLLLHEDGCCSHMKLGLLAQKGTGFSSIVIVVAFSIYSNFNAWMTHRLPVSLT